MSNVYTSSQSWSPSINSQSIFSSNQQQTNNYFNYPSASILDEWKNQEYLPWNQPRVQNNQQSQVARTHEDVDFTHQRLLQQHQLAADQQHKQYTTSNYSNENSTSYDPYSSYQGSTSQQQQQRFTDL